MTNMSSTTTTIRIRKDRFGRTEVWKNIGGEFSLSGRVLPKNCGTWAAAEPGEELAYFDTLAEAIEALS